MSYLGHIVLNSRVTYGKNKKNVTYYAFKPYQKENENENVMIVPYKKETKEDQTNVYVIATINENNPNHKNHIIMSIQAILGKVGTPEAEALYLQHKHNVRTLTKKQKILQPRNYFEQIIAEEATKRNKKEDQVYTIDPEGSSDYDDAISININNNKTTIGVHIADVSFLVSPDSELDKYAKQSLTSIYSNYLKPNNMLPSYICNDLMSLKETKPRLCVSIYYHYNQDKELLHTSIERETLIVTKNCTYKNVRKYLNKDQWNTLTYHSKTTDTHKIVETYMLQTNVLVANILANKSPNNCILRAQEKTIIPEHIDNEFYKKMCNNNATYILGNNNKNQSTTHSSLNEEYYTHFTSPLRRYADIIAHRQLFSKIYQVNEETINSINAINKLSTRLRSDEHKLQLIYDLEQQWKNNETLLQYKGTVMKEENEQVYVHVNIKEKDYLLRIKTNKKEIKQFKTIIIEIIPNINASIFSKKLKLKII